MRGTAVKWIDLVGEQRKVRIRTKISRNLLCTRLLNANLAGPQRGVRGLEFVSNLLPRQGPLGETALCQNCGYKQPNTHATQATFHETSPNFLGSEGNTMFAARHRRW